MDGGGKRKVEGGRPMDHKGIEKRKKAGSV